VHRKKGKNNKTDATGYGRYKDIDKKKVGGDITHIYDMK
jgi:hypothetical protein